MPPGADPLRQRVVAATGGHPGAQRACQERPRREPLAELNEQQSLVVQPPARPTGRLVEPECEQAQLGAFSPQ